RDARRGDADEPVALAAARAPRPADAVGVLERAEQPRDVGGVVLQVRVDGEDGPPPRRLHPGPARGRLAAVGGEALHAETRVARGELLQDGPGAVAAGVVGHDDL